MNNQINLLVKTLFQKESLEHCSVQELQQYVENHPYFGAAQLLLAKKLQSLSHVEYKDQLQKTFLYFHSPLWVESILQDTGNAMITETGTAKIDKSETSSKNIVTQHELAITEKPVIEKEIKQEEAIIKELAITFTPLTTLNTNLTFEPFHTVDYFASLGIKYKEEAKPTDKLGKQLKSFTEWLKTMKKLPVAEITKTITDQAEQKVELLAEDSLQEREIVTVAMAEVWEKQGNIANAIEIYRKLSLLEPSKNAYFASKIEELKKLI